MSYVDSVLGKNEEVLYQAKLSLIPFWSYFLLGVILILGGIGTLVSGNAGVGLVLLVVAVSLFLRPIIWKKTTELVITNRRIISKAGIIARKTIELQLGKIESIQVNQGIFGRIFNYGTLVVGGTGGSKEYIPRISKPLDFRKQYDQVLESHDAKAA